MEHTPISRTTFLGVLPLPFIVRAERPSVARIADTGEPGRRLSISGIVYGIDDRPMPDVRIFLYQTDAAGLYNRGTNNARAARLSGEVWSDAQGRYRFETVQPAHYAGVDPPPPMHIHVHLAPPDLPDHWVESYYFDGDPQLRPADVARAAGLGRRSNIVRLSGDGSGTLVGTRDFRIDAEQPQRNQLVNGWYR